MFINLIDAEIPFREYKLSKNELSKCRKRLLALRPCLCIHDVEDGEDKDLDDVYFIVQDNNQIICVVPDYYAVNVPQIFVLSDDKDYEMSDKEIYDFLAMIHDKHPKFSLSHIQYDPGDDLTGLMYNVACYLTEEPKEAEIFTSYDNYYPHIQTKTRNFDINEAIRLLHIVLTTVYNYPRDYKLNAKVYEDLSLFVNTFAG